jgi:hypothetical protein
MDSLVDDKKQRPHNKKYMSIGVSVQTTSTTRNLSSLASQTPFPYLGFSILTFDQYSFQEKAPTPWWCHLCRNENFALFYSKWHYIMPRDTSWLIA